MREIKIIPILALFCLAFVAIPAAPALAAAPGAVEGQTLAMMGGGGGMMGDHGYGGRGGMMGGDYGWNGSSSGNGFRGYGNSYRNDERRALMEELHRDRQELSDMIHSKNADPDKIDRKMEKIEMLERPLDSTR